MASVLEDSLRAFLRRYRAVSAAALAPQLFLAFGWLRAALAHALDGSWWSGDYILVFLDSETSMAIGGYELFLNNVVRGMPSVTALIVVATELVIGLMLGLNIKPLAAVLIGAFLNLQFILAGVVNPSTFYLVIALVVVLWRMERTVSLSTSRKLARNSAIVAGVVTVALLPYISNPSPATAIEDPALVLIFLSVLSAGATWWTYQRIAFD